MRLFLLTVAIVTIFSFCSKKSDGLPSYYGVWELRSASGGMSPYQEYPSGNGSSIVITQDSISEYSNNVLQYTAAFHLTKGILRGYGEDRIADKFSPDIFRGTSVFFELKKDTLIRYVGVPALDGGWSKYVRK